jgi:fatty acid-binding protein DegV
MAETGILLDSTTVLPPGYVDRSEVTIIPVPIYAGGQEYRDGVTLTEEQFIHLLETLPQRPSTAVPGLGEFVSWFERVLQNHRHVVYPIASRHLSGLFNAAVQAAKSVPGAHVVVIDPADPAQTAGWSTDPAQTAGWSTDPAQNAGWSTEGDDEGVLVLRSADPGVDEQLARVGQLAAPTIVVMNTDFVAGGIALLTIHALEAIEQGTGLEQVLRVMIAAKRGMGLYFILTKLDYVVDRVGHLQAFLGTLLHINPVLAIQDGLVQDVAKVRGERKARSRMVELVKSRAGERAIDAIVLHSLAPGEAQALLAQLQSQVRVRTAWVGGIGCTVSRFTGRGGLGIAFTVV